MIKPKFTFEKIKFSIDPPTFKKAIDLYETSKIKNMVNLNKNLIRKTKFIIKIR